MLQSVALEAFKALERFEYRGTGSLNRFLKKLVVNKIRDRADTFNAQKRAGGVQLSESLAAELPDPRTVTPDPSYLDPERYERLERSLAHLPDDLREVLLLRKVEELSSKEVAEVVGKNDAAVRKTYSRGWRA